MNDQDPADPKRPGGVKHDARGNAVWQWAADTGRHAIDSTSRLLKRLEVPGLKIDDELPAKQAPGAPVNKAGLSLSIDERDHKPKPPDAHGGYDPYGGMGTRAVKRPSAANKGTTAAPPAKAGGASNVRPASAAPESRRSLWQRLTGKR